MATKLIFKKSSTGGSAPSTSDLDQGEFAVNLADRKVYTKDSSNNIVTLGTFVSATEPTAPAEGDLWYDTANDLLKAYNGGSFVSAGYQTLSALEDTNFTSLAEKDFLSYDASASEWVNRTHAAADVQKASELDTDARKAISVTDAGGDGSLAYDSDTGTITYTGPSASEVQAHFSNGTNTTYANGQFNISDTTIRSKISVTDAGGDGSLAYNNSTGVITYTGPTPEETVAHLSGGTGVTLDSDGTISIGQDVATTANVTFDTVNVDSDITVAGTLFGPANFTIDPAAHGDDTGTVIIAGNLTVNGTTTSVNSNEVNIGDSIIVLNSDETGTPSQNAGIEVERGTSANKIFQWNETDDAWDLSNETLQNVSLDGGSY